MEKFGKNVIINVEDSSPLESQLVKYEEQYRSIKEKRSSIEAKVKDTLEKSKHKSRSKSVMMIKQELLEEYSKPIRVAFSLLSSRRSSRCSPCLRYSHLRRSE